jgi:hypothetical protein
LDDISITWSYVDKHAVKLRVNDKSIGDGSGLNNNSELINLLIPGESGQTVDSLTYDHDWGADGNGYTLERVDAEDTSDSPANWNESRQQMGTPGRRNSSPLQITPVEIIREPIR